MAGVLKRQERTFLPPGGDDATGDGLWCPLRYSLGVIGGRWKPLIVYYLLSEPRCFGQIRRLAQGISNKTLSSQLRQLEADGVLLRTVQDDRLRSVRYELTDRGRALQPVVRALIDWAETRTQRSD